MPQWEKPKIIQHHTKTTTKIPLSWQNWFFLQTYIYTILFYSVAVFILLFAFKYSSKLINSSFILKEKVLEVEIKYIILLLFILMFFASLGNGQAILPVFILGVLLATTLREKSNGYIVNYLTFF